MRGYLAWRSINDARDVLDLGRFQLSQAETKLRLSDDAGGSRIAETCGLLLIPSQPDPRQPKYAWDEVRLQEADSSAVRARKLKSDGQLIATYSAACLSLGIERYNLWETPDHLPVKQLWEYFAR